MKIDIKNLTFYSYIILTLIFLCAGISLFCWILNFPGIRYSFVYKSSSSDSYVYEIRYLPLNSAQGKIHNYIDELLLGPVSEHSENIFVSGTKVESCFERNGILYLDLSEDLMKDNPINTDYEEKFKLLKKNIMRNFNLKDVVVFVAGNEIDFSKK